MGRKSRSKKRSYEKPKNEPAPGSSSSLGPAASVPDPIGKRDPSPCYGYRTGDLVYRGKPMAFAVMDKYVKEVCHHCLAVNPTVNCTNCLFPWYCNLQCKSDDTYHELECHLLHAAIPYYPSAFIRYISQIVVKCKADLWGAEGEVLDQYAVTFRDLESCRHPIGDVNLYNRMCQDYQRVASYLDPHHMVSFDVFAELYCKAILYVTKVQVCYSYRSKAIGLYLGLRFFKHSCLPNAIPTWNGREISVRMMEAIDRRSSLLITINMLGHSCSEKDVRIAKLKKLCIPKCFCRRCRTPEEDNRFCTIVPTCTESFFKRVSLSNKLLKDFKNGKEEDVENMMKIGPSIWVQMNGVFGNLHVLTAKIARSLCYAYFRLFKFREASVYCNEYLQFCEAYYGPYHSRTGLSCLFLSYLDALQDKQTAVRNFEQAMEKLVICLGDDHPLFKCLCADYNVLVNCGGWTADNMRRTLLGRYIIIGKALEF